MKKRIAILLLLALTLVSAGCGNTPAQAQSTPAPAATPAPAQTPASAPEAAPAEAPKEAPAEPAQENKSLVVVFSCTGTTKAVAGKIAALTGAELVDLVPAQPYTAEDLNYGVTTLYLGYPIWWGQAPRILSTFVESHDFTGITVVPFCTSGGSGAGRTGETLGEQAGTGTFLTSTRFSSGVSDNELQSWIDSHK